ncbi:MAG: DUF1835 domain-containing protein [Pyrinomonadaceae bacterium]
MSNKLHLLCGDALVPAFKETGIDGQVRVFRECLSDGPVQADTLEEFWDLREGYLATTYPEATVDYRNEVVEELVSVWGAADGRKVYLWFEREFFCQANLWFSLWLLRNTDSKLHIVYPSLKDSESVWLQFAGLDKDGLQDSFDRAHQVTPEEVFLAKQLWEAYAAKDADALQALGAEQSHAFPTLDLVCGFATIADGVAKQALREIIEDTDGTFPAVFRSFCENFPVFGFGDSQVKKLYDEVKGA